MCNYHVSPFNSIVYETIETEYITLAEILVLKISWTEAKTCGRGKIFHTNSICVFRLKQCIKIPFFAFLPTFLIICFSKSMLIILPALFLQSMKTLMS